MIAGMNTNKPAISRLVEAHNGPTALARLVSTAETKVPYQEVQRWVKRGWASPFHFKALEAHLTQDITLDDLHHDREIAKRKSKSSTPHRVRADSAPPTRTQRRELRTA